METNINSGAVNQGPLLSIVTVTYNDLLGVSNTINSIQEQKNIDYQIVEHIVVDGGTEKFPKLVSGSVKVNVLSEPDNGLYDAMNKGVKIANGKYILFLNGGDTLYDAYVLKKISDVLGTLKGNEFLFGRASLEDEGFNEARLYPSERYGSDNVEEFLEKALPCHQAMLIPRWFCIDEPYDTRYRISADAKFKKIVIKSLIPIFLDVPIVSFDLSGISSTTGTLVLLKARIRDSTMSYNDGLSSLRELFSSYIFHIVKYFTAKFKAKPILTLLRKVMRG